MKPEAFGVLLGIVCIACVAVSIKTGSPMLGGALAAMFCAFVLWVGGQ